MAGNRKSDNEPELKGDMSAGGEHENLRDGIQEDFNIAVPYGNIAHSSFETTLEALDDISFDQRNPLAGEANAKIELSRAQSEGNADKVSYTHSHTEIDINGPEYSHSSETLSQQIERYSSHENLNEAGQESDQWHWIKTINIYFSEAFSHLKQTTDSKLESAYVFFDEQRNNILDQKERMIGRFDESIAQVKGYFKHNDLDKESDRASDNYVISYPEDNTLNDDNEGHLPKPIRYSGIDSINDRHEENDGWGWNETPNSYFAQLRENILEIKKKTLDEVCETIAKTKAYLYRKGSEHSEDNISDNSHSSKINNNPTDMNVRMASLFDETKKSISQAFVIPKFVFDSRSWASGARLSLIGKISELLHAIDDKLRLIPSLIDSVITAIYHRIASLSEIARYYQKQIIWFFAAVSIAAATYGLFILDDGNILSKKTLMSFFNNDKVASMTSVGLQKSESKTVAPGRMGPYQSKPGQRAEGSLTPTKNKVLATPPKPNVEAMAKNGDAKSQFELGSKLINQAGVDGSPKAGLEWIKKSSEQGYAPAQSRLGTIYEEGILETRDLARAEKLYKSAADAGNAQAMHNLAVVLSRTTGRKNSPGQSLSWFKEAASYGVKDSQYNLGLIYANGIGVKVDWVEAYKWLDLAASQGDKEAAKLRDSIGRRMLLEQIDSAKESSREFVAKTPNPKTNYIVSRSDTSE